MRSRWQTHLLAILGYALLALFLTWPLLEHFATHVPGNGADDPPLTWNLWWVSRAVLQLQTNPFLSAPIFYPIGINLAFYTLTILNGLLSVPLQSVAGLIPATNLLLLSSFVLSGYGAYLLALYLLCPQGDGQSRNSSTSSPRFLGAAAFSAGLLYGFASSKLFYAALGQWNIASSQWIPFYVLFLFKTGAAPFSLRYPLLAGLFLILQAYAELTYASFLVLFTLLWALWRVCASGRPATRKHRARLVLNLVLVASVVAIGLIPILANMLPDLQTEGDLFTAGGGFADAFSADLAGYAVPISLHPLLGTLVDHARFPHDVGQHLYMGYSVLILSLAGLLYWRRQRRAGARTGTSALELLPPPASPAKPTCRFSPYHLAQQAGFWCLSALTWWLLTLGPTLRINGHDTRIPLPFRLVSLLPFFSGNRYPSRYSVLLLLSLSVLVALGIAAILDRPHRIGTRFGSLSVRVAAPLLLLVMLFEHLAAPLPLSDMTVSSIYGEIASIEGDWTLLDIPVAWRNGSRVTGTLDPIIMFEQYYQTTHEKRILAGNTSRNPPLKLQYFSEAPVISSLIALETGHDIDPEVLERDRALAPEVLRFFDIRVIVVHTNKAGKSVTSYLETTMPVTRFFEDKSTIGYVVDLPSWPERWTVRPGDELGRLSYAEGWGAPGQGWIWAQRRETRLLVPMNGHAQVMTFSAYAPQAGQELSIMVNGTLAATLEIDARIRNYDLRIPASIVKAGLNEVILRFEHLFPVDRARAPAQGIGETKFDTSVSLVAQSAGNEIGDSGLVFVNGTQVSPNQRGYNVVVLDPQTAAVDGAASFDTHLDPEASQALADYLRKISTGKLVVVVAADEASRLLGTEAVEALHGIGATGDLRDRFRWAHAVIGVRGAPRGTALEAMNWLRPVSVVVGLGATEPHLAAALGTIAFSSVDTP